MERNLKLKERRVLNKVTWLPKSSHCNGMADVYADTKARIQTHKYIKSICLCTYKFYGIIRSRSGSCRKLLIMFVLYSVLFSVCAY